MQNAKTTHSVTTSLPLSDFKLLQQIEHERNLKVAQLVRIAVREFLIANETVKK